MTGSTVGRYELLEKLGEGGMGVVYRARDIHLHRNAALKFLSAGAGLGDDRKQRFLQEAQVASALNHPNIVTIYEIGLEPPHEYIAMEYVPGRPLDKILRAGGTRGKEVLAYAVQIADALAAAHAAGIVHRDVKPGNVIITDTGAVKVLDFGLAKLVEQAPLAEDNATRTLPLGASPHTVKGAIMGTVAYMSPEQAEGKPVDHRSDIFSFGAMLYEMLSGKRPFTGDSPVSTMAAILRAEPPDLAGQLPDIPPAFDRIVRRCLEKAPQRRWQSMADVRAMLDDVKHDLESGTGSRAVAAETRRPSRAPWLVAGLAAAVALAVAVFTLLRPRDSRPRAPSYTFRRITSDAASNVSPAISRDGKLIAYSSDRAASGSTDIWVQQLAGGQPVRLTSGLGLCHSPSFSPDGSRIAFHGGPDSRGIYVASTFGGDAQRVADGYGAEFSPDGTQIAYMGAVNDRIMLVSPMGGTPREVKVRHPVSNRARWLPDGRRLLYYGIDPTTPNNGEWHSVAADGSDERPCQSSRWLIDGFRGAVPQAVWSGGVLIAAGGADTANLYLVPFDMKEARVTGAPVPVTMAPGLNFAPSASADGTKVAFATTPSYNTNIWELSVDAATGLAGAVRQLTSGQVDRSAPYPSRDGTRVVYKATSGRSQEIRILTFETGQEARLAETSEATRPVLSEDGAQVAYAVQEKDGRSIYTIPVTGGVAARRLCTGCGRPGQWYGRGTRILYDQAARNTEIAVLDVSAGQSTTILRAPKGTRIYSPRLSPDGRLLCFTHITSAGQRRLYLVPFGENRLIPESEWSRATAWATPDEREPVWSHDGRILYFLSERDGFRCVWGVRVGADLKTAGEPFAAHHLHQYRHSLLDFTDVADVGLSIAGRKMFLAVRELQSNIWLAERADSGAPVP